MTARQFLALVLEWQSLIVIWSQFWPILETEVWAKAVLVGPVVRLGQYQFFTIKRMDHRDPETVPEQQYPEHVRLSLELIISDPVYDSLPTPNWEWIAPYLVFVCEF